MKRNINKRIVRPALTALFSMVALAPLMAQETKEVTFTTPTTVNLVLLVVAILLMIVLYFLSKTLVTSMRVFEAKKKNGGSLKSWILLLLGLGMGLSSHAQDAAAEAISVSASSPAEPSSFNYESYVLIFLITVLFFGIVIISYWINRFISFEVQESGKTVAVEEGPTLWDTMNAFKPLSEEAGLDTGHDYDGIRELNNITPPWFTVSFIASIIFAVIYMWRYHVSYSAPLMIEEYEIAVAEAKVKQDEFLKKQANLVDENNVVVLGAADLEAGKKLYKANCVACHLDNGGGSVGPNLTDNFSIHGNDVKSLFKTIKYGWTDKGMKSWKDDFSPNQIAQLSTYVHSLIGTNVAGGKDPQGNPDSGLSGAVDSAAVVSPVDSLAPTK